MISFGLVTFISYLLGRSMQIEADKLNVLALVGGVGFVMLCIGVYLLIKNRKHIEYTDEYKSYLAKSKTIDLKNKSDSDLILKKYDSMPDLKDGGKN